MFGSNERKTMIKKDSQPGKIIISLDGKDEMTKYLDMTKIPLINKEKVSEVWLNATSRRVIQRVGSFCVFRKLYLKKDDVPNDESQLENDLGSFFKMYTTTIWNNSCGKITEWKNEIIRGINSYVTEIKFAHNLSKKMNEVIRKIIDEKVVLSTEGLTEGRILAYRRIWMYKGEERNDLVEKIYYLCFCALGADSAAVSYLDSCSFGNEKTREKLYSNEKNTFTFYGEMMGNERIKNLVVPKYPDERFCLYSLIEKYLDHIGQHYRWGGVFRTCDESDFINGKYYFKPRNRIHKPDAIKIIDRLEFEYLGCDLKNFIYHRIMNVGPTFEETHDVLRRFRVLSKDTNSNAEINENNGPVNSSNGVNAATFPIINNGSYAFEETSENNRPALSTYGGNATTFPIMNNGMCGSISNPKEERRENNRPVIPTPNDFITGVSNPNNSTPWMNNIDDRDECFDDEQSNNHFMRDENFDEDGIENAGIGIKTKKLDFNFGEIGEDF